MMNLESLKNEKYALNTKELANVYGSGPKSSWEQRDTELQGGGQDCDTVLVDICYDM